VKGTRKSLTVGASRPPLGSGPARQRPARGGYIHRVDRHLAQRLARGALGILMVAGCAGLQSVFRNPDVNLQRVALRNVGLTGGTMDLVVGVYNPNAFSLQGTRLQLGLDVERSHVGDVEYSSTFQAQQGDTTVLTVPLVFSWTGMAGAVRTALGGGDLPYKLNGQLTVSTPIGQQQVPFSHEGRAPLSRIGDVIQRSTAR
jgi:LEA14-like dessication related protein